MVLDDFNCQEQALVIINLMLDNTEKGGNPSVNWYSDELKKSIVESFDSGNISRINKAIEILRGEDGSYVPNRRYDNFLDKIHPGFFDVSNQPLTRADVLKQYLRLCETKTIIPEASPQHPTIEKTEQSSTQSSSKVI